MLNPLNVKQNGVGNQAISSVVSSVENVEPAESLPSLEPGINSAGHISFHSFKKEKKKLASFYFSFYFLMPTTAKLKRYHNQIYNLLKVLLKFKLILKLKRKWKVRKTCWFFHVAVA